MNAVNATRLLAWLSAPLASEAPSGPHPDLELHDKARIAVIQPLENKQSDMLDRIYQIQATTLDGHVARARAAVAWAPDLLSEGTGDTHMVILFALLRDLLGACPLEGLVNSLKHYSDDLYEALDDLERSNPSSPPSHPSLAGAAA
jgi:hypothetical protein